MGRTGAIVTAACNASWKRKMRFRQRSNLRDHIFGEVHFLAVGHAFIHHEHSGNHHDVVALHEVWPRLISSDPCSTESYSWGDEQMLRMFSACAATSDVTHVRLLGDRAQFLQRNLLQVGESERRKNLTEARTFITRPILYCR
jgi:hypothetical protein